MGALAARAAGTGTPGDMFGLLAAQGQHAIAIPMNSGHGAGVPPAQPAAPPPDTSGHGAGVPTTPPATPTQTGTAPSTPTGTPSMGQYDVSADPVLQQVNAAMALADQNAQSSALRNRQQALLAYGDSDLAGKILGANDPLAQAAGLNQEGTVEQLLRGYQSGLHNFDQQLDPSLAYSGYRVGGEGEIGQGYQDSLSQAAQAINAQLGGYNDQLNAQLAADQQQRTQALADAYNRAVQAALAGGG